MYKDHPILKTDHHNNIVIETPRGYIIPTYDMVIDTKVVRNHRGAPEDARLCTVTVTIIVNNELK